MRSGELTGARGGRAGRAGSAACLPRAVWRRCSGCWGGRLAERAEGMLEAVPGVQGEGPRGSGVRRRPVQQPAADVSTDASEEAGREAEGLRLDLDLVAGRLIARGRLDRGTAHLAYDAIAAMLAAEREHWRVDVAELVVRDRFGLRVLTAAYRRLLRRGRRMTLEGASPELQHALTRLRLDGHLLPRRSTRSERPANPRAV